MNAHIVAYCLLLSASSTVVAGEESECPPPVVDATDHSLYSTTAANFARKTPGEPGDKRLSFRVLTHKSGSKPELSIHYSNGKTEKAPAGAVLIGFDVVQPKALIQKMVPETAAMIEKELTAKGKVDLYGIYFDFNKSDLKLESTPTITEVAKVLKSSPALALRVVGHTDNIGDKAYNDKLSGQRAQAVATELIKSHGVQAARLKSEGLGDSKPVASNDTDEGRAKNRRVELIKL